MSGSGRPSKSPPHMPSSTTASPTKSGKGAASGTELRVAQDESSGAAESLGYVGLQPPRPNSTSYQQQAASIVSSTVSSVSAAVGHLSRQPTFESALASGTAFFHDAAAAAAAAAATTTTAAAADGWDDSSCDSLLHQKLYESNVGLNDRLESLLTTESLDKVPVHLRNKCMKSLNTTQFHLQESVLAMQESNQNSDKLIQAMDQVTATAQTIKFPV